MKHTGHTKDTENIGLLEDLRMEFKSDVKKLSEETIVEAVVALANTEGGTLYIGVEDDGTPENYPMFLRDIRRYMVNAYGLDVSAYPVLDATFDDLSLLEFERMRSMISKYRGDQSLLELDN